MGRLEKLSVAIGQLNPASSEKNSPSASGSSYSGLKMSFDSQKVDRWQKSQGQNSSISDSSKIDKISENGEQNEKTLADTGAKQKRKLVRQKKSIAKDDWKFSLIIVLVTFVLALYLVLSFSVINIQLFIIHEAYHKYRLIFYLLRDNYFFINQYVLKKCQKMPLTH